LLAFLAHDSPPRGDDESELRHLSKIWGPLQIALIANHHRSIQSERQLKTTQDQNLFTNYVKHIEQFEEFLKDENVFKKLDDLLRGSKVSEHDL
jgi:hypothetical protein